MENLIKKIYFIADILQYVFIPVYVILLLFKYIPPSFFFVLPVIQIALFIFTRLIEDNKKESVNLKASLVVLVFLIPYYLCKNLKYLKSISIPLYLPLMFSFPLSMLLLLFFTTKWEVVEVTLSKAREKTNLRLIVTKKMENVNSDNYEVKICVDNETKMDVYMDADSRYVHLLILGPTGCGKTSLTLVPMIFQDVTMGRGVTVIEPKGDLAEKVYAMGKLANREVLYFNPVAPDCPSFNPLDGDETEVSETLATVFEMLTPDSKQYYKDLSNDLIKKSIMVLKRIEFAYTDPDTGISSKPATLIRLSDLIQNTDGSARRILNELSEIPCFSKSEQKQNQDTIAWFLGEYYKERNDVIYQNTSGVRTQVSNLIQNKYLRKILNPENGKSDINFDKHLEEGGLLAITTAQGELRGLSSYLGYFIIFTLQSSIFRRPGNEWTRKPNFMYVDECQKYLTTGFCDILTQGRSYRVSAILATQSREMLGMNAGNNAKGFLATISANCRNVILFPGIASEDAEYYSKSFGDIIKQDVRTSESAQKFSLGAGYRPPTESVSKADKREAEYSSSDLMYKAFNSITYRIIKEKTVQRARTGTVNWIDKATDNKINKIVKKYTEEQRKKMNSVEKEESEKRANLIRDFLKKKKKSESNESDNSTDKKGKPVNPNNSNNDDSKPLNDDTETSNNVRRGKGVKINVSDAPNDTEDSRYIYDSTEALETLLEQERQRIS